MVDIKGQAADFTVDGLHVVSNIFARIDAVILFKGAVKGVIIRKTAFGRDGRDRFFFMSSRLASSSRCWMTYW